MPLSLEESRAFAQPWLAPIRPEAPAGTPAKTLPAYQRIVGEVGKLESPTGGAVNWTTVLQEGGELLQGHSKDLLVASYVSFALHATKGLKGLLGGIVFLTELIEGFWPALFPESTRMRGRANALEWFVQRASIALVSATPHSDDRDLVDALDTAVTRFIETTRKAFNGTGPALSPLADGIAKLKLALPSATPPPSVSAPATVSNTSTIKPALVVDSPDALTQYARELGTQLATAAATLRSHKNDDPLGYRLLRVGLWMAIGVPPPTDASGRTRVPGPTPAVREKLRLLQTHSKWAELIEEGEAALSQARLWLDVHRFVAEALSQLSLAHQSARAALVEEVVHLLRRLPGLKSLAFQDGTPFADEETLRWLEAQEAPPSADPKASGIRPPPADAAGIEGTLESAQRLLASGKAPEAIAALHEASRAGGNGMDRFKARLALAKALSAQGKIPAAKALYNALDAEMQARGLETWTPRLAAECLLGYLNLLKISRKAPLANDPEWDSAYRRLCQLDLAAALPLGQNSTQGP
ncbi:MAG: type VI secretion system protein TssA [Myxococcaceae bacterium]